MAHVRFSDSSSSSDSDDFDLELLSMPKEYKLRINFTPSTDFGFNEKFRVNRVTAEAILERIGKFLTHPTKKNKALSPQQQLLISLHWMGNGCQFHGIADIHGVSKSTVHRCVKTVTHLVVQHLMPEEVRWPTSGINDIPVQFMKFRGFPRIAGCVDGSLIPIDAPTQFEASYVDRYGNHSINLLVVCGPNLEFFYASARWPGSVHDSRVLRNSSLSKTWNDGWRPFPNAIILGDSGYSLKSWLIPPVINCPLSAKAESFLRAHKSTRRVVENSLGILKEKFPSLNRLRLQPIAAAYIILCCITFHNMEKRFGSEKYDAYEEEDGDYDLAAEVEVDDLNGNEVVTELMNYFQ